MTSRRLHLRLTSNPKKVIMQIVTLSKQPSVSDAQYKSSKGESVDLALAGLIERLPYPCQLF